MSKKYTNLLVNLQTCEIHFWSIHIILTTHTQVTIYFCDKKMLKQANLKLLDDRMMKNLGKLYAGKDKYGWLFLIEFFAYLQTRKIHTHAAKFIRYSFQVKFTNSLQNYMFCIKSDFRSALVIAQVVSLE